MGHIGMTLIKRIYEGGQVQTATGETVKLAHHISRDESNFLQTIIAADKTIRLTLEVGCADGLSSLSICGALRDRPDANHTIIDPISMDGAKELASPI
jgi:hypothetical protein